MPAARTPREGVACYVDAWGRRCLTNDRDRTMVRRIRWRGLVQAIHRAPPRSPERLRGAGTPYDPAGAHVGITRALHWTPSRSPRVGAALWGLRSRVGGGK